MATQNEKLRGYVLGGSVVTLAPEQTMAERFLALKEKIAQDTVQSAAVVRADLDSRMLAHIHYRASELIDLVLG